MPGEHLREGLKCSLAPEVQGMQEGQGLKEELC